MLDWAQDMLAAYDADDTLPVMLLWGVRIAVGYDASGAETFLCAADGVETPDTEALHAIVDFIQKCIEDEVAKESDIEDDMERLEGDDPWFVTIKVSEEGVGGDGSVP